MQLVQLIMQTEAAKPTIDRLGDLGIMEFKDVRTWPPDRSTRAFLPSSTRRSTRVQLNADKGSFQRTYAANVKRCDDMERILRYLHSAVVEANITPVSRPVDRTNEPNLVDLQGRLEELERQARRIRARSAFVSGCRCSRVPPQVREMRASNESLQRKHDQVQPKRSSACI